MSCFWPDESSQIRVVRPTGIVAERIHLNRDFPLNELMEGRMRVENAKSDLVKLATSLQRRATARLARLSSACTGGHRACARRVAGSANPTNSAGHAPARTEADYELTYNLDHSMGADHLLGGDYE